MPCGESKTETFHTFEQIVKLQNGVDKGNIIQYIASASLLSSVGGIDLYA